MRTSLFTPVRTSIKIQTLATLTAIAAAVALPQVFHALGVAMGVNSALGATLLPMHLPVIFVALVAGPAAGLVTGVAAPMVSFALSGMPTASLLPLMALELGSYGLVAGYLANKQIPTIGKVVIAQIAGRGVRALAIIVTAVMLSGAAVSFGSVVQSTIAGLPGVALQLAVLPLAISLLDARNRRA